MVDLIHLSYSDLGDEADRIAKTQSGRTFAGVFGIPRGGTYVAMMVAQRLGLPLLEEPTDGALIVDDLVDSGDTWRRWNDKGAAFDALYRKPLSPLLAAPAASQVDGWLVFPWERHEGSAGPEDAVRRLLQGIGEDVNREGLIATPGRVVRAFREMTDGYGAEPAKILATTFDEQSDEMIVVSNVEFTSLCEHHMLPFTGYATVGYLPQGRVVGLSKLPRLVDAFAHRLQVQERMTRQIAEAIDDTLKPLGVGVVVTAHHSCMGIRGVRKSNARMTTSALFGAMRDNGMARAEFLSHHQA